LSERVALSLNDVIIQGRRTLYLCKAERLDRGLENQLDSLGSCKVQLTNHTSSHHRSTSFIHIKRELFSLF
jgi:hypothetical protein